jgi:hypothetical protein
VPSKPHVVLSAAWQAEAVRGGMPEGRNVHVPIESDALHVLQDSLQALLQQRPSTQKLLAQSPSQVQAWPFGFLVSASWPHPPVSPVLVVSCPASDGASPPAAPSGRRSGPPSCCGWFDEPPPQPTSASSATQAAMPPNPDLFIKPRPPMISGGRYHAAAGEEQAPGGRAGRCFP